MHHLGPMMRIPAPASTLPAAIVPIILCVDLPHAFGRFPTRLVVTEDEPHPSPELVTVAAPPEPGSFLTGRALPVRPSVGRAGAADDRQPMVTSGQQR
jgi:hypothetical protein